MQQKSFFLQLRVSVLLGLFGLALFVGCTQQPTTIVTPMATQPPTATPSPLPTPLPRGGNLTIRLAKDIPWLQPWRPRSRGEEQLISLLYNGLVRLDHTLQPQPDLAQRWQISADGRMITFTLRSDVTWHDGQPLDAVDVHFTLDRIRALPFTSTALLADMQRITAIATPDRQTVVLSLTERYAPMLSELTLPILPRHLLERKDLGTMNFWDVPVGSGPFVFERLDRGRSVVLARNEHYHRGAPLLDRVAFVGSADEDVTVQALQDGRLLLAELAWNTTRNLTKTLSSIRIGSYPENGFYFLGFNLREGHVFADVQVRQALAKAIDLPVIVESVTKGQGIPIAGSAVPGSWADMTSLATKSADLDAAGAILNEAGWVLPPGSTIRHRNGVPFQATLFVRGDDVRRVAVARRIAEIADSLGLHITVQPADFATVIFSKYAPPYDFDLLLGSWVNGVGDAEFPDYAYYDPDDFALFHSSQINQGPIDTRITRNFVGFRDPVYDTQSLIARQLYDIDARRGAMKQAQDRVAHLLPYLYLWVDRIPVALSNRVTTLDGPIDLSMPNYLRNIERWYLTEAQ